MNKGKIVLFGELLLRLKAPGYERFLQSPFFEATFGGGEANVAVSLARFGMEVEYVTLLPDNPIGDASIAALQGNRVGTNHVLRKGERIGIYFLEAGVTQRPSQVIYDRGNSAIALADPGDLDWEGIFEDARWFHVTGITPAISMNASELTLQAVRIAKKKGLTVSCDYNFRNKLWKYGKSAPEIMGEIVKFIDVGIANEEDCQRSLGISLESGDWKREIELGQLDRAKYEALCQKVMAVFPNLSCQAITLRESFNASHNGWSACLHNGKEFIVSKRYDISPVIDRIGSGDSFSAGLIYGLLNGMNHSDALNFATAASCLKHSIIGDANLVSLAEVMRLAGGEGSGRVQR